MSRLTASPDELHVGIDALVLVDELVVAVWAVVVPELEELELPDEPPHAARSGTSAAAAMQTAPMRALR